MYDMRRVTALWLLVAVSIGAPLLGAIIGAGNVKAAGVPCGGSAFVFSDDGSGMPGCAVARYTRLGVALMFMGWGGVAAIAAVVVGAMPERPKVEEPYVPVEPERSDPV
jgi:hypothetical protein